MSQSEYFELVQSLAADLNKKDIKLPSFPDVVVRVRTALDDPDTTSTDLASILGVDAVLASRVLILANSTYHNPGGIKIEGLEAAVGRIGFEKVRTAAIAYAVEQLHASEGLEPLKDELRATWSAGMRLAAMSEVIARHCTKLDGDSAFIAGLLHRIGVLYLYTKYHDYPALLQDQEARSNLIDEWAAPIGESIVGNWNFSAEIQATLNPDEVETTRRRVEPNLADIVTTAKHSLNGGEEDWHDTEEAKRLGLTDEKLPKIMESYREKLDSLASAVR
ncbi:MAG: HDOD domain-containing protein [Gammaproteobacteria bacterium]|nr:HDOD domain-containing protein [Gammaproteobacteria bacterium]